MPPRAASDTAALMMALIQQQQATLEQMQRQLAQVQPARPAPAVRQRRPRLSPASARSSACGSGLRRRLVSEIAVKSRANMLENIPTCLKVNYVRSLWRADRGELSPQYNKPSTPRPRAWAGAAFTMKFYERAQ